MIAASIALAVVGLAALWTLRDVALRLHAGSEARAAIVIAKAAQEAAESACAEMAGRVDAAEKTLAKVKSEHETLKAGRAFGGGGRR